MGRTYKLQKQYTPALRHYKKCLEVRKSVYGPDHIYIAETLSAVSDILSLLNREEEMEEHLREVRVYIYICHYKILSVDCV